MTKGLVVEKIREHIGIYDQGVREEFERARMDVVRDIGQVNEYMSKSGWLWYRESS